jgi:hypothetical protein
MSRRARRWCGRILGSRPGRKVSESYGEPLDVQDAGLQERIVRGCRQKTQEWWCERCVSSTYN